MPCHRKYLPLAATLIDDHPNMKDLIYYPNFESTNNNWLKFALLYIDKLNLIIPPTGDSERSELYRQLINETDLIHLHRPHYHEGYTSSLDAIDIAERIANSPLRFDLKLGQVNAIRHWQDKTQQIYKLYGEKFSHDWEHFCISNKFARKTNGGLLISEQLGTLYMIVLANTIADCEGKSPITDKTNINRLSYFLKSKAPNLTKELNNAQAVIELKLPAKLSHISFDEIIKLRNSKNFKKHLKAFHSELDNFYKNIEAGKTETDFVDKYNNVLSDFTESISSLSLDTTNFALGAGMLLKSADYTETEFFKSIILAGTTLIVKSGFSLNKTWKNSQPKRHCRRYLTQLTRLRPYRQGSR